MAVPSQRTQSDRLASSKSWAPSAPTDHEIHNQSITLIEEAAGIEIIQYMSTHTYFHSSQISLGLLYVNTHQLRIAVQILWTIIVETFTRTLAIGAPVTTNSSHEPPHTPPLTTPRMISLNYPPLMTLITLNYSDLQLSQNSNMKSDSGMPTTPSMISGRPFTCTTLVAARSGHNSLASAQELELGLSSIPSRMMPVTVRNATADPTQPFLHWVFQRTQS